MNPQEHLPKHLIDYSTYDWQANKPTKYIPVYWHIENDLCLGYCLIDEVTTYNVQMTYNLLHMPTATPEFVEGVTEPIDTEIDDEMTFHLDYSYKYSLFTSCAGHHQWQDREHFEQYMKGVRFLYDTAEQYYKENRI